MQVDAEARTPDGLRRREFIRLGADKAAADRRERLADDPFAYAAEHPTLGRSRADVIALQKAMGVEAYSFMSAGEAVERVRTYAATSDADKAALLRQWSAEAGKHRPALLRDLAAAQLPAPALLLLRHADNPRLGPVLDRTFAAAGQDVRKLILGVAGPVGCEIHKYVPSSGANRSNSLGREYQIAGTGQSSLRRL